MNAASVSEMEGVPDWGGYHHETACLRNALTRAGHRAPHSDGAWTEAMLFGIGGGVGFAYSMLPVRSGTFLALGTRHMAVNHSDAFLRGICSRIGVRTHRHESPSELAAENALVEAVLGGRPVLAWCDLASLPYYRLPTALLRMFPHVVRVTAFDEEAEEFELDDRASVPVVLDAARFRVARHAIPSLQHRFLELGDSVEFDLAAAVREGIRETTRAHLDAPLRCYGLAGLRTWSRKLANRSDPKGWPGLFPRGLALYRALANVFHFIETAGTGGGAFRPLYGDFMIEAAEVLGADRYYEQARRWHAIGEEWTALAEAALPDAVPHLREAKGLLRHKYQRFELEGLGAAAAIASTSARLAAIEAEMDEAFPLGEAATLDLLGELADRIDRIEALERAATEDLAALTG